MSGSSRGPRRADCGSWSGRAATGTSRSWTAAARPRRPSRPLPERGRIASGCFDGTWRLDEAFLVRGDEALRARATPTQYFVLGEGFRVAFEKDAAGKIAVMVVKVPGREMRANRIE